jgi:hypothetical protein
MSEPKGHWWSKDRFDLVITPNGSSRNWVKDAFLNGPTEEDKKELMESRAQWHEAELEVARERARLSVLTLTEKDKRFLKSLKVAY